MLKLRVRGAGASSGNSQGLYFALRGARVNAKAQPIDEYRLQVPADIASHIESAAIVPKGRPSLSQQGQHPHTGALNAALLAWAAARFTVFPVELDAAGADHAALWKDIHNVIDVAFDEDEDANPVEPLSAAALASARVSTAADAHANLPTHRTVMPTWSIAGDGSAAALPVASPVAAPPAAADDRSLVVVLAGRIASAASLLPSSDASSSAAAPPHQWAPLSMRAALTAQALALAPTPAPRTLIVVLPSAAGSDRPRLLESGYAAALVVGWLAAARRAFLNYNGAAEAQIAELMGHVRGLAGVDAVEAALNNNNHQQHPNETADIGYRYALIAADDARLPALLAAARDVIAVPNDNAQAEELAGMLKPAPTAAGATDVPQRRTRLLDARPYLAGEVPDARIFDLSEAAEAKRREGLRENFCPCCGSCGH